MMDLLFKATLETLLMVGISSFMATVLGGILGVALMVYGPQGLKPCGWLYNTLGLGVNAVRSIPYIILTVLMIPLTRLLVGTSIGTAAAIVPLALAGMLLVARGVEDALNNVPKGLIEVGQAFGAGTRQIILKILWPEALPQIVAVVTLVVINIVGFSAMAGAVGGGGLGDLAIRYGYQRYDLSLLLAIVIVLILMVQLVQSTGNWLIRCLRK